MALRLTRGELIAVVTSLQPHQHGQLVALGSDVRAGVQVQGIRTDRGARLVCTLLEDHGELDAMGDLVGLRVAMGPLAYELQCEVSARYKGQLRLRLPRAGVRVAERRHARMGTSGLFDLRACLWMPGAPEALARRVLDLSIGGAALELTREPPAPRARVELDLELSGAARATCPGVVRWIARRGPDRWHLGVQLVPEGASAGGGLHRLCSLVRFELDVAFAQRRRPGR